MKQDWIRNFLKEKQYLSAMIWLILRKVIAYSNLLIHFINGEINKQINASVNQPQEQDTL